MLFNTIAFAKFFLFVFVVSWLLSRWPKVRFGFLAVMSYVFYSGWNVRYLPLLFGCSTLDYVLGRPGDDRDGVMTVDASVAHADVVALYDVLGRLGHEAHPNPGRRRLVVTSRVERLEPIDVASTSHRSAGLTPAWLRARATSSRNSTAPSPRGREAPLLVCFAAG